MESHKGIQKIESGSKSALKPIEDKEDGEIYREVYQRDRFQTTSGLSGAVVPVYDAVPSAVVYSSCCCDRSPILWFVILPCEKSVPFGS